MENGVFQVYWNPDPGQFPPTNFDEKFGGGAIPWYNGQPLLAWKNPVPTVGQLLSSLKDLMNATQHPGEPSVLGLSLPLYIMLQGAKRSRSAA